MEMDIAEHCPAITYIFTVEVLGDTTHIKRCRKMDCLTLYDVGGYRKELEMVVGSECARF